MLPEKVDSLPEFEMLMSSKSADPEIVHTPVLGALLISVRLFSFFELSRANRSIEALFAFFVFILTLGSCFFIIGREYLGAVLIVVYLGAVLIFFMFVLFTLDPRWFHSEYAKGLRSTVGGVQFAKTLQYFLAYVYIVFFM